MSGPQFASSLLGYTSDQLNSAEAQQAQGVADVYIATEPCIAHITGAPMPTFMLKPIFIAGV
ncbi:MAG: hypothetical protein ACR2OC_08440 [Solirubrobacterales bacterium]